MTQLVNVKVANIRPKYNNLKEWMNDLNNVYIGRKGIVFIDGMRYPKQDSIWCNPFKISDGYLTREECIEEYELYIREKIIKEKLYDELKKLKGKTLGCWCIPQSCHGEVLIKLINELI